MSVCSLESRRRRRRRRCRIIAPFTAEFSFVEFVIVSGDCRRQSAMTGASVRAVCRPSILFIGAPLAYDSSFNDIEMRALTLVERARAIAITIKYNFAADRAERKMRHTRERTSDARRRNDRPSR